MSRVEDLKQGLIAGVRDRSWRGRGERARQARRWALLAEVGHLLEASLDFESTLERIASLVVPGAGDRAVVHVIDPDGSVRPVGPDPGEDVPPDKVLRTGEAELSPERMV